MIFSVGVFLKEKQTNMGNKDGNVFQVYFQMLVKYRHKR